MHCSKNQYSFTLDYWCIRNVLLEQKVNCITFQVIAYFVLNSNSIHTTDAITVTMCCKYTFKYAIINSLRKVRNCKLHIDAIFLTYKVLLSNLVQVHHPEHCPSCCWWCLQSSLSQLGDASGFKFVMQ